jgi:tRNA wybutosine-synthesizing protein 1
MDTRSVLRMTLIRDHNNSEEMIPVFADLIKRSNVHFVEVKSYMHIGRSTNRLQRSDMLDFAEVQYFAYQLAKKSHIFDVMDESEASRIVVLQNQQRLIDRWIADYTVAT